MKCVAIDDEKNALEVIRLYVERVPELELLSMFTNPIEASQFIESNDVDLLFLDINMPGLTGFEFLETLSKKPLVIFTTAYSEYAVKSYSVDALDYLVKPISFSRFLKGVNKAKSHISEPQNTPSEFLQKSSEPKIISIKSGTSLHRISVDTIVFVQSDGNYLHVQCVDQKIMTLSTMKEILEVLGDGFIQTHRSYAAAINRIKKIDGYDIKVDNFEIPLGASFKKQVMEKIG